MLKHAFKVSNFGQNLSLRREETWSWSYCSPLEALPEISKGAREKLILKIKYKYPAAPLTWVLRIEFQGASALRLGTTDPRYQQLQQFWTSLRNNKWWWCFPLWDAPTVCLVCYGNGWIQSFFPNWI